MTKPNPLRELNRFGVSVWYDNLSRSLIDSGTLKRLIQDDGVKGVTSNPTIFEKAIGSSTDYDEAIRRLGAGAAAAHEIFEAVAVEDICGAADLLRPVYDETQGADGFVSLELPPALARDAAGSAREAVRLFKRLDRPNAMIKIPGTKEGVRAFEETTALGVPVNVTLLFSQERYAEVIEAYLTGLERRAAAHHDLSKVASVASFFVSRVDSALDPLLEKEGGAEALALRGKLAIANAKLAYQLYKRAFSSERFKRLAAKGARPQRLLWASTATKNPAYRDVLYVEELIGPDTVNTMPPATLDAFRDHGACRPSLEEGVAEARAQWEALASHGIDTSAICRRLEEEGLNSFCGSFEALMGKIAAKREIIRAEAGTVEEGLSKLSKALFAARLFAKDASLWKAEASHQKIIKNSLGWLTAPEAMAAGLGTVRVFAAEVRKEGFETAVVLGMGGSSLSCEVFRTVFARAPGAPRLEVLDTTNPASIAALEKRLDLKRTLFIVSSKSGSTVEPNCLMDYFWGKTEALLGAKTGGRFCAITDAGSSLEKTARSRGFRKVFLNPADVGGRYSALTYFGLVPAAVMGVDVELLLARARAALRDASPETPAARHSALRLGATLGQHARRGQDKLVLSLPPALESFGLWIEQLIAESTGKEGLGIVPVCGEPPVAGRDRLIVRLETPDAPDRAAVEARLAALECAGQPVLTLHLKDPYDLGAHFIIWEIATAAACFLLGVNPFDQPDVQAAKDRTNDLLCGLEKGRLPAETAPLRAGGMAAFADEPLLNILKASVREACPQLPLSEVLAAHFKRLKPGDYAALLVYADPSEETRLALEPLLASVRRLSSCPVALQWGPRYLHSTGQLHKGGGANGLFLMLCEDPRTSLSIPGKPYGFATLHRAQARGDFQALLEAGRRALCLELSAAGEKPWRALANAAESLAGAPR